MGISARLTSKRSPAREKYPGGAGFIKRKGRLGINQTRTNGLDDRIDQLAAATRTYFAGQSATGGAYGRNRRGTFGVRAKIRRLDFPATFYLDRGVPAVDNGACRSAIGQSTQTGAVAFATTHWSVVLEAQGESPAAQKALEILCRTYWRPLYGFARRRGLTREEAQDLVQEFFARLLEHRNLDMVRREKGRLRSYLLVSLKRFLATERQRAGGVKRYESGPHIPLDELLESEVTDFELAETFSADRLYERRWALAVLEQVLGRLESDYQAANNAVLFDHLKEFLVGEQDRPLQAEIAAQLGMTENAVKQAFHRFRQRYRVLLREEIAHTVIAPGDVEDELRHLVSVLRG